MKGLDFVKKLNETLGVTIPEDVLTKLGEIELPDEIQTKFSEIFISKERAKHDSEIIDHVTKDVRKEHFRIMDEKIKTFLPLISEGQQNVINNEYQTYKKYDLLKGAMEDSLKNVKGKVSEDVRKVEEEWAAKLKAKEEDFVKQSATQEAKFKDAQIDFVMRSKLLAYQFADSFLPVKDALINAAIIEIKSQPYQFDLENGSVAIRQEKDGVKRDVFEQGTENKLTLEKMLDSRINPFIKKNNSETKEIKEEGGKEQQKQQFESKSNGTLRDRMQQAAQV